MTDSITIYDDQFYNEELKSSIAAARTIVPLILSLAKVESVLDVGCGAGAFLDKFRSSGIKDIIGIDGHYLPISKLLIDAASFQSHDISRPFNLERRFDLVLCLEVAEHIFSDTADVLVESLCKHSDVIVFSAAVPGQGGTHHVNEQLASYWAAKFEAKGYTLIDPIRPQIWSNPEVDYWYRQNIVVYSSGAGLKNNPKLESHKKKLPDIVIDKIHPIGYLDKVRTVAALRETDAHISTEIEQMRAELAILREAENNLLRDLSVLRNAESNFLRDIADIRISAAQTGLQRDEVARHRDELLVKLDHAQTRLTSIQAERSAWLEREREVEHKITALEAQLEQQMVAYDRALADIEAQYSSMQSERMHAQGERSAWLERDREVGRKVATLEAQLEQQVAAYERVQTEIETQRAIIQSERIHIQGERSAWLERERDVERKIAKLEAQLDQQVIAFETQRLTIQSERIHIQGERAEIRAENEKLSASLTEALATLKYQRVAADEVKEALSAAAAEAREAKAANQAAMSEMVVLRETVGRLADDLCQANALLDEKAQEIELAAFLGEAHARTLRDVIAKSRALIRQERRKARSKVESPVSMAPASLNLLDIVKRTVKSALGAVGDARPGEPATSSRPLRHITYVNGCPEGESKRYRIENIAEAFRRRGVQIEIFGTADLEPVHEAIEHTDLLVIFRTRYSEDVADLIRDANALRCPVVFDVDDLVFEVESVDYIGAVQGLLPEQKVFHRQEVERFRRTLDMCDVATTTTAFLANRLRNAGIEALVIPNTINPAQMIIARSLAPPGPRQTDIVKIGYFSGSPTHNKDFLEAADALLSVLRAHENVEFHLVGDLDLGKSFASVSERIVRHKFMPYLDMLRFMAEMSLVIAPLELNNPFSQGKSELKIFEAAVVKVPCVASATDAYGAVISHGRNGMLCRNREQWFEALSLLVSDVDARVRIGQAAYDEIVPMFDIAEQAEKIYATYEHARRFALGQVGAKWLDDIRDIRASGMFSTAWYLDRYRDVKAAAINPIFHYIEYGAGEGRDPGPAFDTRYYLTVNNDVAEAGMNPLLHYIRHGQMEGRRPHRVLESSSTQPLADMGGESAGVAADTNAPEPLSFDPFKYYNLLIVHCGDRDTLPKRLIHLQQGISGMGFACTSVHISQLAAVINYAIQAEIVLFSGVAALERDAIDPFVDHAARESIKIVLDATEEGPLDTDGRSAWSLLVGLADVIALPLLPQGRSPVGRDVPLAALPPSLYDEPLAHPKGEPAAELSLAVTGRHIEQDVGAWTSELLGLLHREPHLRIKLFGTGQLGPIAQSDRIEVVNIDEYGLSAHLRRCHVHLIVDAVDGGSFDGKGMALWLEAAALGIPTIAPRHGALADLIENGVDGLFAEGPEDACDAVVRLMAKPALLHHYGKAAREKARRHYSVQGAAATFARSVGLTCDRAATEKVLTKGRLNIAWVIPDLIIGGGGHRNILRAANFLDSFGHRISLYFIDTRSSASALKRGVREHFYDFDCDVHVFDGNIEPADVVFATHWTTVAPALTAQGDATEIIYFVQDYEPIFTSMGSDYVRAENTYRKGLYCITSGAWCENFLKKDFGAEADHFRFPVDRTIYYPRSMEKSANPKIIFFAKPEMPRRCFELGILALREVYRLRPNVEIVFFGSKHAASLSYDFPVTILSLVPTLDDLAELYSSGTIGLVFSTSNPSLIPYEMMACGLPVVDLDRGNNEVNYDGRHDIALLADPEPEVMARQIIEFIDDSEDLAVRRNNGLAFVEGFPSEEGMAQRIEELMMERVRRKTKSRKTSKPARK